MISRTRIIVAVEGACYAGKSTLIENLRRSTNDTLSIMPDYMDLADPKVRLTPPHPTHLAELAAVEYFLRIDADRLATVPTMGNVICDRSYHTLLAHVYSVTGGDRGDLYNRCLAMTLRLRPYTTAFTLYLDTSFTELRRRWSANGNCLDRFFRGREFNEGFRRYFLDAYSDSKNSLAFISGDQSEKEVLSAAMDQLSGWSVIVP